MEQANTPKKTASKNSGKLSKFSAKDYITILVAALLLIAGIVISIWKNFEIELMVFIFIAFSIGLLSFLMIGKIGTKDLSFMGIKISQASGGFLVFIIILASFLGYKKITNKTKLDNIASDLKGSLQIREPIDSLVWRDASGTFKWFNPPLSFATDEHLKLKMNWFNHEDFVLKILLVESYKHLQDSAFFIPRLKRLQKFVIALRKKYEDIPNLDERIKVRICKDEFIPSQSFFIDNKWGNTGLPNSIFYLPNKKFEDKPLKCIISSSKEFYGILNEEFELHWQNDGMDISLNKLIEIQITESTTREAIKEN